MAHSRPSEIHWPVLALELLETALFDWCLRRGLPVYSYTTQKVYNAATDHPNSSKDELGYSVMVGLGLIGAEKNAQEWEAIVVGNYHMAKQLVNLQPAPVPANVPESSSGKNHGAPLVRWRCDYLAPYLAGRFHH